MANAITRALAWPLIGLVKLYRVAISPWLGMNCRYQPTCSEYAIEALREHGVFRGSWLAAKRIGRSAPTVSRTAAPGPRRSSCPTASS